MQKNSGTIFGTSIPLTKRLGLLLALGLLLGGTAPWCRACAVCFGKTADPIIQATSLGILTLLGVVCSVLLGVAAFFVVISRRCRRSEMWAEMQYSPRSTTEVHHE